MTPSDHTRLDTQLQRLHLHHIQSHYQAAATKAAEQQGSSRHSAHVDHSPQPHAEKSTSNTQASRLSQASARKITANFNPMVLDEIRAAGNSRNETTGQAPAKRRERPLQFHKRNLRQDCELSSQRSPAGCNGVGRGALQWPLASYS